MSEDYALPGGADGLELGRVKRIMQVEAQCLTVNPESTFLVCRAAELFLDALTERSGLAVGPGHELEYEHVASAVQGWPSAQFLADIVPRKVSAGDLRADPRFQGTGAVQLPLQPPPGVQQQEQTVVASLPSPQHPQHQAQQHAQPATQHHHHHQHQSQQQQHHLQQQQAQQQQLLLQAQMEQQQLLVQQRQLLLQQQPHLHLTQEQQQALHMQQLAAQQQLQYHQLQLLMLQQQQQQHLLMAGQQAATLMGGVGGFPGADASMGSVGLRAPGDMV